ncbi:hypothetical protein [Streptomyces luteireticuli]|uniref:hypothetical protein n=1 Tax=Streptomyces luteireticuli TaxID=173858 RepID=UPI0035586147
MDAPRRTGLLLTAAVCGSLALSAVPAAADAPPAAPVPAPAARPLFGPVRATAPDELRRVSADAVRALDHDATGQRAAEAVVACDSLARPTPAQGMVCGAVRERLGVLAGARSELQQQATSPAPDGAKVDCAMGDARRARSELDPYDDDPDSYRESDRRHESDSYHERESGWHHHDSDPRHESGWHHHDSGPRHDSGWDRDSYHDSAGANGGLLGLLGRLGSMTIDGAGKEISRLAKLFGIPAPGR